MSPTAHKIFALTIVLSVAVWLGVGWLWFSQQGQPNFSSLTQSLSSLPLISSLVPTSIPSPSAPTSLPTLSGTLATFTDNEFGFSFGYPVEWSVTEISNPREKLLEFAKENFHPLPTEAGLEPHPTPSLKTTLPILKQYSVVSGDNSTLGLIDISVVEGSYLAQIQEAQEMAKAFKTKNLEEEDMPSYHQLKQGSGQAVSVLTLPYDGVNSYNVAYYPLGKNTYLQVEVQPELYPLLLENKRVDFVDTVFTSVKT